MPLGLVKTVDDSNRMQCDVEFVDVNKDRLFSSAESGKIKIWRTEDLQPVGELDANQASICCIVSHGTRLYAGTSGGNIVVFDIETQTVTKELNCHEGSVLVLRMFGDVLYSGDTEGKIMNWKDDQMIHQYETCEEVWDMALSDDFIYSIRDRDLLVQRIVKGERGNKLNVVKTVEGRGPLRRANGKIFLLSRDGMDVQILEDGPSYQRIGTIKGQDRMINALAYNAQGSRLYSGGWDNTVRVYDAQTFAPLSSIELGHAVNCIRTDSTDGSDEYVYVGGNNGLLCKLLDI